MKYILWLTVGIAEYLCGWWIFSRRLKTTPVRKYLSLAFAPFMCAITLFSVMFSVSELIKYAAVFVLDMLAALIFFKGKFSLKLLWSLLHTYILSLCSSIAVTVMATSPEKLALIYTLGITSALCWGAYVLLCAAASILILRLTEKEEIRPSIVKWMSVFSVVSIIAMYSKRIFTDNPAGCIQTGTLVITGFAILAVVAAIPFVFILLNNSIERQSRTELEKLALGQELKYLGQLSDLAVKVREIKHDYANHMSVMVNLAEKGDTDELLRYVRSYRDEYGVVDMYAITGNIPLDSLLSAKFIICRQHEIEVDSRIFKWGETKLTSEELCSVFGNLLDNAIEASRMVENAPRYINIKTQRVSSMLNINIENSYDPHAVSDRRKGEHGFGLPRVRSVVEKYNGVCTISCDGTRFSVDILLPLRE